MAATRSSRVGAGAVLVIVLILAALALSKVAHVRFRHPVGSGCIVRGAKFDVSLSSDQAALAATIAGVAKHRSMPAKAVTIAYATALQESKLQNLRYGDRDSVGIFQQRPSQGWGSRSELLDPVYASTRFFAALRAVPGYQHLMVYQAAQAVQHSADGYAYSQWVPQGTVMASGFTGQSPRSVWCWYGTGVHGKGQLAVAGQQLSRAFGRMGIGRSGDPVMRVRVRHLPVGWAVASWLVCHAGGLHISFVGYDGYEWTAAQGRKGWVEQKAASQHGNSQHGNSQHGNSQHGSGQNGTSQHGGDLPSSSPQAGGQDTAGGPPPTGRFAVVFG